MRLFRIAAVMVLLSAPSFAFAQDWFEYLNREDMFVVNFPHQPMIEETTYQSEYEATLPARVYTAESGLSRYSITVVDYEDAEVADVRGSVAWAAWAFRKRGGEVAHDAFNQNDRIEGHQLHIVNPDGSRTLVAIHQHARRLYILEATTPPNYPPAADFQQTLVILDPEGRRVRYNLDDDGNRTDRIPTDVYVPVAN